MDEWKKTLRSPDENSQSSLNRYKPNHDNGKRPSSPGGAATPVASDHESDEEQGLVDLQRKRNELLSQLQGLEDCPTPDSQMSGRESNADAADGGTKHAEKKNSVPEVRITTTSCHECTQLCCIYFNITCRVCRESTQKLLIPGYQ